MKLFRTAEEKAQVMEKNLSSLEELMDKTVDISSASSKIKAKLDIRHFDEANELYLTLVSAYEILSEDSELDPTGLDRNTGSREISKIRELIKTLGPHVTRLSKLFGPTNLDEAIRYVNKINQIQLNITSNILAYNEKHERYCPNH
jgi:hypothetical protein